MSPKARRIKRADEIIRRLNNEEALYNTSWLEWVVDEATDDDYEDSVADYEDIMKLFAYIFLRYIKDGILADYDDKRWEYVNLVEE